MLISVLGGSPGRTSAGASARLPAATGAENDRGLAGSVRMASRRIGISAKIQCVITAFAAAGFYYI
ncbi:hypothetical protein [Streptomyces griseofuscus]|uniref:hypothetical protein n=1 Tax=Streptomyces griseofuscus TaxID=146922 RepID=UPI0012FF26A5|nr:hypothetical protein [Streptomyces griseofuscus]